MANSFFKFKQFTIHQDRCAMKVTTDACLFGAWVANEIGSLKADAGSLLDIGTGTGVLTLMIAQKSGMFIETIEIDKEAFMQASENITSSPYKKRIMAHHADIKGFHTEKKYDIIISNPPFYENELKSDSSKKNIAHHSQDLSLPELFIAIKNCLAREGLFFLLLPFKRHDEIKKRMAEHDIAVSQMVFVRQSVQHDYFRIMLSGTVDNSGISATQISEMAIWDESKQYTPEFTALLKDYYLYL